MSNFDPESPSDNDWEESGELAWNEFDWEQYLRGQDEVIQRYVAFYEQLRDHPQRIDEVAHLMGWDKEAWSSEGNDSDLDPEDIEDADFDSDPYTLHKNPVFVATRGIFLTLKRAWECLAHDPSRVPQRLALAFQTSLYRAEDNAMLAIQALDFGDYAMAISLLKRSLRDLNESFALLDEKSVAFSRALTAFRHDSFPRLFDLREIWLRVMEECRHELSRPRESDDDES
ncbi:hypothetical protein [Nibricoccus sp. IMCC34717]|uniref:hypothetical protein n=1 Tax=Nibricoccus sp. IMCC34717 TaxID=3034021 RepID=UPI0038501180